MQVIFVPCSELMDNDVVLGVRRDGRYAAWQSPLRVRNIRGVRRWCDEQNRDQGAVMCSAYFGCEMKVIRK